MQQMYSQQGLRPQMYSQQVSRPQQAQQSIKFYKSGIFGFSSAPGRMQRDVERMQREGWKLQHAAYLGTNFWWRRIVVATWTR